VRGRKKPGERGSPGLSIFDSAHPIRARAFLPEGRKKKGKPLKKKEKGKEEKVDSQLRLTRDENPV